METENLTQTRTRVSSAIAYGLLFTAGVASAAGFLFFGKKEPVVSTTTSKTTSTQTSTPVDLTTALNPLNVTATMASEYDTALAETLAIVQPSDVQITVTKPTEGAMINDETGNFVTATLVDPNNKVASLYVRTFNDRYKYMIGWSNDSTAPYEWNTALSMYPSGEYRDVVYARDASGKFIAWADVMYTKTHNCYYLGYQDMTLSGPTSAVTPGTTFSLTGTIKNNIRGACQNIYTISTFDLENHRSLLPDGWTATVTPADPMVVGVNQTKTFTVAITVPATAVAGTQTVGVSSNRQYTGFTVKKTVEITVGQSTTSGGGGPSRIPDLSE